MVVAPFDQDRKAGILPAVFLIRVTIYRGYPVHHHNFKTLIE
jgi:hypothetical protein